jgi:hypothetical protein
VLLLTLVLVLLAPVSHRSPPVPLSHRLPSSTRRQPVRRAERGRGTVHQVQRGDAASSRDP